MAAAASSLAAAALGALLLAPQQAAAFYLPGVAPTNFIEGQRVELKVREGEGEREVCV